MNTGEWMTTNGIDKWILSHTPKGKTYQVTPDPTCRYCHGSGTVYDIVDYGSTTAQMPSDCGCIDEQLPEEFDCAIDQVEIVS